MPLLSLLLLAAALPGAAAPQATGPVSAAALEARHGLKVTRVAVTGGGGLVDLRFTVVDPEKARALLGDDGHAIRLLAGPGGAPIEAPHHGTMRSVRLARDAACFVLFPNARGAVRRGGGVAVAFGGVTLGGLTAQ